MFRLVLIFILISSPAFAGTTQEMSYDIGLDAAPTFTPETGYSNVHLRLGLEAGVSFFKYEDISLVKVKGLSDPDQPTLKLLRVGVGYIADQPVLLLSPLSARVKDNLYLSPSFGFGKQPYTLFSFSYELYP